MSVVRVNPESVRHYAAKATEGFGLARTELEAMVRAAVEVRYFGPNADSFKTQCGQLALEFSASLLIDFQKIADAVQASTTNIASSLGGLPVTIAVNGAPLGLPMVPRADVENAVDIDTSALGALDPTVVKHLDAVRSVLAAHLANLRATDWQGTAKTNAEQAVATFTAQAEAKVDQAKTTISKFIQDQLQSVQTADR